MPQKQEIPPSCRSRRNNTSFLRTNWSLIRQLRNAADASSWKQFDDQYRPAIYRNVKQRVYERQDALDIVQEVILKVASKISHYDPNPEKGRFRGWLFSIVRNKTTDHLRKQTTRRKRLAESEIPEDTVSDQEPDDDLTFLIQATLERVKARTRPLDYQIFWLTTCREQPKQQVAEQQGVSIVNVYHARSRVHKVFREEYQRLKKLPPAILGTGAPSADFHRPVLAQTQSRND